MAEALRTCPVCGAGLEAAESAPAESVPWWKRRAVRIGAIVAAVAVAALLIAGAVAALTEDARLRASAHAVADGSVQLVSGGSGSAEGCIARTDSAWLFASAGCLSAVRSQPDGAWTLEQTTDGGNSWRTVMEGEGQLLACALAGESLFYSLSEGGSASTLRSQSVSGGFSEYPSARNIAEAAATDEMVVTRSVAGTLGWLNVKSGIWHDLQDQVDAATGVSGTRVEEVSASGTCAIATTSTGQIVLVDVNSESSGVLLEDQPQ